MQHLQIEHLGGEALPVSPFLRRLHAPSQCVGTNDNFSAFQQSEFAFELVGNQPDTEPTRNSPNRFCPYSFARHPALD
jgi:hypothetical protein